MLLQKKSNSMIEIPLFDDDYREAFLYLLDEIDKVRSCSDFQKAWYPQDHDKLEDALKVYKRWHPDPDKNPILDFPWPKTGEIPKVPRDYLKPTDEEKKKIQNFIDSHETQEMDPMTEMIVQLAKELMQEVH